MTRPRKIAAAVATAASATMLALPGAAGAAHAGEHNFEQTYPVASKLCAEIAKGAGPKRLRSSAAAVLADCTVLENNFNADRTAIVATEVAIANAVATDNLARKTVCTSTPAHPLRCATARKKTQRLHRRLARQKLFAARAYWRMVEANRAAFWDEIRALPGGKGIAPDKPIAEQNN